MPSRCMCEVNHSESRSGESVSRCFPLPLPSIDCWLLRKPVPSIYPRTVHLPMGNVLIQIGVSLCVGHIQTGLDQNEVPNCGKKGYGSTYWTWKKRSQNLLSPVPLHHWLSIPNVLLPTSSELKCMGQGPCFQCPLRYVQQGSLPNPRNQITCYGSFTWTRLPKNSSHQSGGERPRNWLFTAG